MSVGLLGRKIGMTQVYDADGVIVPVTVIEAGPCVVLQVRTMARDGYDAVQLGFGDRSRTKSSRSVRGHVTVLGGRRQQSRSLAGVAAVAKAECEPKRFVREFRCKDASHGLEVGQVVGPALLDGLKFLDVIGVSIGRGFTGVMRRHNFGGMPASHGAKRVHRSGGSIGQSADPSRVLAGTKMPGRYGGVRVTSRNLRLVRVDNESNVLLVRGAVPGPTGSFVVVRRSAKNRV
jgi:large subunit ribosomal protein L3